MSTSNELKRKLQLIKQKFDTNHLLSISMDSSYIQNYYKVNRLAYSLFHSLSDFVHMGISRDGKFKPSDLLEPLHVVDRSIRHYHAKNVLELATGRGANSAYLAKKNPHVQFTGIDISQEQLSFARKKAKKCSNFTVQLGDYHNLTVFPKESFDIVFIIEALCYSLQKENVLREVNRVLRKKGIFIVIDGYRNTDGKKLTEDQMLAIQLAERGMAVQELENYKDFLAKVKEANFTVVEEEDVSQYVMPTLKRFESLAEFYLRLPIVSHIIINLFPKAFTYNAISGLLLPTIMNENLGSYYITVLKKK